MAIVQRASGACARRCRRWRRSRWWPRIATRAAPVTPLTLDVPLRVFESEPGVYFVPGTPTDCVHLAISGLFDFEHDMVVSGVKRRPEPGR